MRISGKLSLAAAMAVLALVALATSALAETHEKIGEFGSFLNPNGIAIDESTGDVYVADIGTSTVSKFDADGNAVNFSALGSNELTGGATPIGSFSFPMMPGNPAAIAVDNSTSPSDSSAGDLYVMDAGHDVIDKFNSKGEYLSQITGPFAGALLGLGVDGSGNVRVDVNTGPRQPAIDVFDNSAVNDFVTLLDKPDVTSQVPLPSGEPTYGFAAGSPIGDDYLLFSCGCVEKVGSHGETLGRVDDGSEDVAVATDKATGHVYIEEQASITEWDSGAMNGPTRQTDGEAEMSSGTLVSRFGVGLLSSPLGQGAIAVNSVSGNIYVSNPATGEIGIFGSTAPAVAATPAAEVTKTAAKLRGTVNPRGVQVSSCEFEYGTTPALGVRGSHSFYGQSVPCEQTVGSGTGPVAVSADVSGLQSGVLYHFRLVARNANGTSSSASLFPTVSAGFGVKSFEVAFLNEDGSPDTQAGSHPYEIAYNMAVNTQVVPVEPGSDMRYVTQPNGNLKDVISNFPPGFYGDPSAPTKQCTIAELINKIESLETECPQESEVGILQAETTRHGIPQFNEGGVFSTTPPRGVAFQLAAHLLVPIVSINVGVPAGGNSGVRATVTGAPTTEPVLSSRFVIFGGPPHGATKPLLTLPTACNGPLTSTVSMDSYQNPGHFVGASAVTRNAAGAPGGMTGCSKLTFPPELMLVPDAPDASTSSGLTVGVHVSQKAAFNPKGLAESTLRNTTVTLPAGVALNPAGADGLEACSEDLVGFTGFTEFNPQFEPGDKTGTFTEALPNPLLPGSNFCPNGSKIGTAEIETPLLPHGQALKGDVYLAAQNANPFGSLVAMYMIVNDPVSGTIVKLPGHVELGEPGVDNGLAPGQIRTTFKNTPELPFEDLRLHFFGGERAPLATPSHCGTYTTQASFTPWDGNGPVNTISSFQITSGPHGSPCPGPSLPFAPSLTAGTTNIQAGDFSPFTMTMSREDGQQNLQAVSLKMPPGLSGLLSGVKLCGEAEANAGTCGPDSEIGETIVSVGVGNQPFTVTGGKVYITGPYKGAPFGLSIVNPAKAGPFDLGKVIVRAKIEVDPHTTALTITSDNEGSFKIPQYIKGIPLQIKHVNVTITRPGFTFNPTNCSKMAIGANLSAVEGGTQALLVPFQATNCAALGFKPKFAVSTSGKTSKARGASLNVKLTYPKAPFGSQANIKSVKVDLPKKLPSRLTTLQKACTAAQFKANPAGCPAASIVGHAKAITPLIPVPLEGPAYFVSNGGEAFPNLIMVLQGYGVTVDLVGATFISKAGITSSTFKTVPDAPVGSFELNLPQGKFSALAANGNLCRSKLLMPTFFTAQNGAVIHQSTKIKVTGCPKHHKHHKAKKKAKKAHSGKGNAGKRR